MRRLGRLWPELISNDNLWGAWGKARQHKRYRPAVADFALNLESELLQLQRELINGCYQPGEYRLFTIYERKPRLIAAAPLRDRIVHHAVMNIIEPPIDQRFIYDSYACRKGKGVHAAVDRYQTWSQRYRYALKLDIQRYFPSIDPLLLKTKLRRYLSNDNGHRFHRRLRCFARHYQLNQLQWADFNPSVQAWIGHACHADTWNLRKTLFNQVYFTWGASRQSPSG